MLNLACGDELAVVKKANHSYKHAKVDELQG